MGMDYKYAGSASYPRFDEEIEKCACVFGGRKTKYLTQLEEDVSKSSWVAQMFGTISSDPNSEKLKFEFPEGTPAIIIRFFNNPYGQFSIEETKQLMACFEDHIEELEKISHQIVFELEIVTECNESWSIH